jgi:predicted DNA-binding transcriptional regulator AlpA
MPLGHGSCSSLSRSMTAHTKYPEMIRAKEVAKILGVSISHVGNLVKHGHLVRIQIGSRAFAYDPIEVHLLSIRGVSICRPISACGIAKTNVVAKQKWVYSLIARVFK